jgi:hypothetical protein
MRYARMWSPYPLTVFGDSPRRPANQVVRYSPVVVAVVADTPARTRAATVSRSGSGLPLLQAYSFGHPPLSRLPVVSSLQVQRLVIDRSLITVLPDRRRRGRLCF